MKKEFFVLFFVIINFVSSADVVKIVSGKSHTLILMDDGSVWGFGWNKAGQLGNDSEKNIIKPIKIKYLNNIIDIAAGDIHSIALRKDDIVLTIGGNFSGQLGNFTNESSDIPMVARENISNFLKDVIKISAGWDFSVVLKKDGTVWTFGENKYGQLGDGTTKNRNYPSPVKGPYGKGYLKDIIDVKAGAFHVIALSKDGTLWVWGDNEFGQLGDGTYETHYYPVKVNSIQNIVKISCGAFHSAAINKKGYLFTWGRNWKGQLGDGTYENKNVPVIVRDEDGKFLRDIVDVSLGRNHTIALNKNGEVYVWGSNVFGQLGNNILKKVNFPIKVSFKGKNLNNITKISASGSYSVALSKDGTLYFWGSNEGFLDTGNWSSYFPIPLYKF